MPKLLASYCSHINPEYHSWYKLLEQNQVDELFKLVTPANVNASMGKEGEVWSQYSLLDLAIYGGRVDIVKKLLACDGLDHKKLITGGYNILSLALWEYGQCAEHRAAQKQIILEILKKDASLCALASVATRLKSHSIENEPFAQLIQKHIAYQACTDKEKDKKDEIAKEITALYKTLGEDDHQASLWLLIEEARQNIWQALDPMLKKNDHAGAKAAFEKIYAAKDEKGKALLIQQLIDRFESRKTLSQCKTYQEFLDAGALAAELVQEKAPLKKNNVLRKHFNPFHPVAALGLFLINTKLAPQLATDQANIIAGLKFLFGTQDNKFPQNLSKAIACFAQVKENSELEKLAFLHQYHALLMHYRKVDAPAQAEVFTDILKLHENLKRKYTEYHQLDKRFLFDLLLQAIKEFPHHEHQEQLYEFMTSLCLGDKHLESSFVEGLLIASKAVLTTNGKSFPACDQYMGDFYAQKDDAQSQQTALATYRIAMNAGVQSAVLSVANLTDDVDEKIKLYQLALDYYVQQQNPVKVAEIGEKLNALHISHYLTGSQKEVLAKMERLPALKQSCYQAQLKKITTLEALSQKENLSTEEEAQLAAITKESKGPFMTAAQTLQKYFQQKAQQSLLVSDKQLKNKYKYRPDLKYEAACNDCLPQVMELMNYYLTRMDFSIGSKRRKIYLCVKTLLLAMPLDRAQQRFQGLSYQDVSLAEIELAIHQATSYLLKKSIDESYKYKAFAKWCLTLVKEQQEKNVLILNPDALLFKQGAKDGFSLDVKHAMEELNASVYASTGLWINSPSLIKAKSTEAIQALPDLGKPVDVKEVIETLKITVAQSAEHVTVSSDVTRDILGLDLLEQTISQASIAEVTQPLKPAPLAPDCNTFPVYPAMPALTEDIRITTLRAQQLAAVAQSSFEGSMSLDYLRVEPGVAGSSTAQVFSRLESRPNVVVEATTDSQKETEVTRTMLPAAASSYSPGQFQPSAPEKPQAKSKAKKARSQPVALMA